MKTLVALLLFLVVAAVPLTAAAQGFLVDPMRVDLEVPAGKTAEVSVRIQNTDGTSARVVKAGLMELSQAEGGAWTLLEDSQPGPFSSLPWAHLTADSAEIQPLQSANFTVRLDIPANARGYYFAALVAESVPPATNGIVVRVRFLIPVIIEIVGRPVRQQVSIFDLEMSRVSGTLATTPTTIASLVVVNEGRTYSRVRGQVFIEVKEGAQWRPVTRLPVPERSILPGLKLRLATDLDRRLPSGEYRLRGDLFVDGRRVAPLTKELAFEGDPDATTIAYDTALLLEPSSVIMNVVPGATRTSTIAVENPGTQDVQVSMAATTPSSLNGVAMGNLQGIDLSAEPWTQVQPQRFTLRPGRTQHVRVISRVPPDGVLYPNYYAELTVDGTYADGQSAGQTRTSVHLANSKIASVADGMVEQLSISEGSSPAQFLVQSRFTNIGNVDFEPTAALLLASAQGVQLRNIPLSAESGTILPLGKRTYGAELSIEGLVSGYYGLRVLYQLNESTSISKQLVVRLDDEKAIGQDGVTVSTPIFSVAGDEATASLETTN